MYNGGPLREIEEIPQFNNWQIFKDIMSIHIPFTLSSFLMIFAEVINVAFIGHQNDTYMIAGIGCAVMYLNFVCIPFLFGISLSVLVFVSQEFKLGHIKECGNYLNRSFIVTTVFYVPIALLLLMATYFLKKLDLDDDVINCTQNYLTRMIPGLYIMGIVDNIRKYMVAFGMPVSALISTSVATIIHPIWCILFIRHLQMDIPGAALASTLTLLITFLIQVIQLKTQKPFQGGFFMINS